MNLRVLVLAVFLAATTRGDLATDDVNSTSLRLPSIEKRADGYGNAFNEEKVLNLRQITDPSNFPNAHKKHLVAAVSKFWVKPRIPQEDLAQQTFKIFHVERVKSNLFTSKRWIKWVERVKVAIPDRTKRDEELTRIMVEEFGLPLFFQKLHEASKNPETSETAKYFERLEYDRLLKNKVFPEEFREQLGLQHLESDIELTRYYLKFRSRFLMLATPVEELKVPKLLKEVMDEPTKRTIELFGEFGKEEPDMVAKMFELKFNNEREVEHPLFNIWIDFMMAYLDEKFVASATFLQTFRLLESSAAAGNKRSLQIKETFSRRWISSDRSLKDVAKMLQLGKNQADSSWINRLELQLYMSYMRKYILTHRKADPMLSWVLSKLVGLKHERSRKYQTRFVNFFRDNFQPSEVLTILRLDNEGGQIKNRPLVEFGLQYVASFLLKNPKAEPSILKTLKLLCHHGNSDDMFAFAKLWVSLETTPETFLKMLGIKKIDASILNHDLRDLWLAFLAQYGARLPSQALPHEMLQTINHLTTSAMMDNRSSREALAKIFHFWSRKNLTQDDMFKMLRLHTFRPHYFINPLLSTWDMYQLTFVTMHPTEPQQQLSDMIFRCFNVNDVEKLTAGAKHIPDMLHSKVKTVVKELQDKVDHFFGRT
ncbi:hypothetical protein CCR75_008217 [Bremia lactucae]|uniref:RxLR effector protein n=1 Tax=Bremia lactucae TaxID=4779 RepID=A0A976FNJ3_BRELC|nr:hypothetical protein CCR75_008217 [Bremia lactucae]